MKTLGELDAERANNFDAMRFAAATLVIFSHAHALSGHSGEEPLAGASRFITFGGLAVEIFFVISGYLVTQSLMRQSSLIAFAEARILRIFPALVVCCAISTLVLGLAVTTLPLGEYLTSGQTWTYLFGNASLSNIQWFLPGVFENNVYKGAVNGSLGTLPTELKMYFVVGMCGLLTLALKRYREQLIGVIAIVYMVYTFATQSSALGNHTSSGPIVSIICFVFGMLFHLWRHAIPISSTVALLLWAGVLFQRDTNIAIPLYYVALSYSIFAIAFDRGLRLDRFGKHGDFSYGLYLYGFPVKQAIMLMIGTSSSNALFMLAFPITLLLAWLSWQFIEEPMLRRKGTASKLLAKVFGQKATESRSQPTT